MNISIESQLHDAVSQQLMRYREMSLAELGSLHLLNRFDEKYLFSSEQLLEFLPQLHPHYRVLQTAMQRTCRYDNLYLDTPELYFYRLHHNGRGNRCKVRFRKYVNTHHCYLEIKRKRNRGHTEKFRLPADRIATELDELQREFLRHHHVPETDRLRPSLFTRFFRITLLHERLSERITLDYALTVSDLNRELHIPHLVVAEIKQARLAYDSPFRQLMLQRRVFPTTFSKYCMGIVLTRPTVKHNRFKPRLLYIRKLLNEQPVHAFPA